MTLCMFGLALAATPSIDEPPVTGARATADRAVVISNESYTGFRHVNYASRDADAFTAWLTRTRGLQGVNVTRVSDATKRAMVDAMSRAAADTPAGGTLWVYYAGHGLGLKLADGAAPERVFLGINAVARSEELPDYVVPVAELQDLAAKSSATRVVFVIDACFNNAGRDGTALVDGRFAVPVQRLSAPGKVVVWSATDADQTAVPFDAARHGAFTYFAVGALSGWADGVRDAPDGTVTLDEAQAYVSRAMTSVGILGQKPQVAGSGEFPVSSGKLVAAPADAFSRADTKAQSSGFGFEADLSGTLAAQACDQDAAVRAEEQVKTRANAEVQEMRDQARAAWVKLQPQLDACLKVDDRAACVAATEKYIAAGKAAKVVMPAGTEVVKTACGDRSRAVAARTLSVDVPEVASAEAYLGRLANPGAGQEGRDAVLGVLRPIPPGRFTMGPASSSDPAREVVISTGYLMMATEVTQGMYRGLMGTNPSATIVEGDSGPAAAVAAPPPRKAKKNPIFVAGPDDNLPVQNVRWIDAIAFANAASEAAGLAPCYKIKGRGAAVWRAGCTGYRLPTEAEWEKAALSTEADTPCAEDNVADVSYANADDRTHGYDLVPSQRFDCDDGVAPLAPVGSLSPNGLGVYDMLGNVREHVWDWAGDYEGSLDPTGPAKSPAGHVIRGGSWESQRSESTPSSRRSSGGFDPANWAWKDTGFRLVRSDPGIRMQAESSVGPPPPP